MSEGYRDTSWDAWNAFRGEREGQVAAMIMDLAVLEWPVTVNQELRTCGGRFGFTAEELSLYLHGSENYTIPTLGKLDRDNILIMTRRTRLTRAGNEAYIRLAAPFWYQHVDYWGRAPRQTHLPPARPVLNRLVRQLRTLLANTGPRTPREQAVWDALMTPEIRLHVPQQRRGRP